MRQHVKQRVMKSIKRIYFDCDYDYYIKKMTKDFHIHNKIIHKINKNEVINIEIDDTIPCSAIDCHFFYEKVVKDSVTILFGSSLSISKITKIYYLVHFSEITLDFDIYDCNTQTFYCQDSRAYTQPQARLDYLIHEILHKKLGYLSLLESEMTCQIPSIKIPALFNKNDNDADGVYANVYQLLFRDTLDIYGQHSVPKKPGF